MSKQASLVIGVDVGGTFTDVFCLDEATGRASIAKVPSVRGDQATGFLAGIRAEVDDLGRVATIVHGTTVGTNALLERKGARTGLITTAGFRDVLEMRRRDRPTTWGLWGQFVPIIPRDLRLEVAERTLADGTIRTAVDLDGVRAAAATLLAAGCEAVALVFINAYANPANEQAAAAALRAVWPTPHVSVSTDILPEIREFERTSTTALNAYLQPPVGSYLTQLTTRLGASGFAGEVLIVQSNGGVTTVPTASAVPVRTALSGPAAGVIACAEIARAAGFPNVITCDMGGTSFDVSLIADGVAAEAPQTAIDFGLVVRSPMIEITTIGAGGGSIARVDRGGLLQIGPESAGSDPGPVAYGRGNDRPTVTDANLVLGRINAERPIGGALTRLDVEAAERAIARHVGEPLGLSPAEAAAAIVRVANARMAGAIRLISIERGHDPKRFLALAFGGGGSLHIGALVTEVGLAGALVPRFPGVTSALGCVLADMRQDHVHTINRLVGQVDFAALSASTAALIADKQAALDRAGVAFAGRRVEVSADLSYLGQTHTVATPLPWQPDQPLTQAGVEAAFASAYRTAYGRVLEGLAVRLLNLRIAVIGVRPKLDLAVLAPAPVAGRTPQLGERRLFVAGSYRTVPVLDRAALPVGALVEGPAILEQSDTTIVVEAAHTARVDPFGNLIMTARA
ncbi:MAG: hydantoinase/oxoprolinase family protein [Alphaproteobacteria bacterium]|nr:hydantoinase/oxoprolinase family protein [Alphaproteobacteria bacterium]TAD91216.1 MAG: hydantoinase/oxoprolinase family protein [Alphaproteobacteria bacterium]